jgi:hypothetical protein
MATNGPRTAGARLLKFFVRAEGLKSLQPPQMRDMRPIRAKRKTACDRHRTTANVAIRIKLLQIAFQRQPDFPYFAHLLNCTFMRIDRCASTKKIGRLGQAFPN